MRWRRSDVLWRRSADRVLILRPGDDHITSLAGTGVVLWDQLEHPHSLRSLREHFTARTAADLEVAAGLEQALGDLQRRGVVDEVDG